MKFVPVQAVFGIHRHALSRAGRVGERVRIVMARKSITKGRTCRTRRTRLRNTAAEEPISLRRIASVDASGYLRSHSVYPLPLALASATLRLQRSV